MGVKLSSEPTIGNHLGRALGDKTQMDNNELFKSVASWIRVPRT